MINGNTYGENSVPVSMMEVLVDKNFAEYVKAEKLQEKSEGGSDDGPEGIGEIIAGVIADGDDKNKKKDLLETWALKNLKIDIDKRKSLDFLIEHVSSEYEKQNG